MVGASTGIVSLPIEVAEDALTLSTRLDNQDKQAIE